VKIRFISVISGKVLVFPPFRYHSFVMTSHSHTPAQKASRLLELHHASQPLILINAWDAASAAMVEHCGLPAIATSSAAMANALGFPDGQYLPWPQMLEAVARVCRAVKVPVTADIESGFAANVTALETSITQIIHAGAVGVNLEDVMPVNPVLQSADPQNGSLKSTDVQSVNLQNAALQNASRQHADPRSANLQSSNIQDAGAKNRGSEGPDAAKNRGSENADANSKQAGSQHSGGKHAIPQPADPIRHGSPLFPLPEQIARIQATRRAAHAAGIHLVINARTDAYWQAGVEPAQAMRNTLERAKAYLQAGADCIFIPGLRNPDHIRTVIDYLRANPPPVDPLPADRLSIEHGEPAINILAGSGVPSIPELAKLGVKRVSYGSGPHRAAMGLLRRIASEAKTSGTFTALTEGAVPYEEINGLMGGREHS
jgi:2-methylisocitrate lyase-like PEP mutase family enzyme